MSTFRCRMTTPAGRVVEKTLMADTKASLQGHLEREGNFVLDIRRAEGVTALLKGGRRRRRVKSKEFLTFNQEFSVLIKAGLPIISALDTIIEKGGENELMDILREIRDDVSGGESLSEAFGKYSHLFSPLYVASLQAGEKSANIALALSRYIEYMKRVSEIKQKVVTASVYPIILTVASVAALLFLLIYVVPTFTRTYFEAGTSLPKLTLVLVNFSHFIKSNFYYLALFLTAMGMGIYHAGKTDAGRELLDKWRLEVPFLGKVYLHYSLSKMARTLSTVLSGGMPLLDSVRISFGALNNQFLRKSLDGATRALEEGSGFSESLSKVDVFPRLAVRMIDAGESSGALEQVLDDMADFYESDVDTKLGILTSAIEPALMIVMGLLIGFIVLAIYLPIFQMAGTVGY